MPLILIAVVLVFFTSMVAPDLTYLAFIFCLITIDLIFTLQRLKRLKRNIDGQINSNKKQFEENFDRYSTLELSGLDNQVDRAGPDADRRAGESQ